MRREGDITTTGESIHNQNDTVTSLHETNATVLWIARETLIEESLKNAAVIPPYTQEFRYWHIISKDQSNNLLHSSPEETVIFDGNTHHENDEAVEVNDETLLEAAIAAGEMTPAFSVESQGAIDTQYLLQLQSFFAVLDARKKQYFNDSSENTSSKNNHVPNTISMYEKDVVRIPMLDDTSEAIILAKGIEMGNNEKLKPRHLQNPAVIAAGERALQELVTANLRLVVDHVFKKYYGSIIEDCIEYGNLGLIEAAKRYDWRRGFAFSTYAHWWIRQGISRGLADNGRTIRLPVYMVELINKISSTTYKLYQELGHHPSDEELAGSLHMTSERLQDIRKRIVQTVSISTPLNEEEKSETLEDIIQDERSTDAIDALAYGDLNEQLVAVFEKVLTLKQQEFMKYRYGVGLATTHTMNELCDHFHISRGGAYEILANAFKRLRKTPEGKALIDYLRS